MTEYEPSFKPIADYALVADCRTGALVARDGGIDWLCLPDFHSPWLLAGILDPARGGYLTTAGERGKPAGRRYVSGTNVLQTDLECPGGRIRLTDVLTADARTAELMQPESELLRIVEALDGEPEFRIEFCPAAATGLSQGRLSDRGRIGWAIERPEAFYLLRSDVELAPGQGGRLTGAARIRAGERRYLSLSTVSRDPAVVPSLGREADDKLGRSCAWWRQWSSQCTYDGRYGDAVLRSVLALKAMQFCLSGAVVAAPTTSLPEAPGGPRNWDYRYCWIRDAGFTLRSFVDLGFTSEAAAFLEWLMHSTRLTRPRLQAFYDVYGRTDLAERTIDDLSGYLCSRPVRIGNAAFNQLQIDVYGALVEAAANYLRSGNPLDPSEHRLLRRLGRTVCRLWREPDNGIWEFRGRRRHNTWSKAMCWSSLDRLLALDEAGSLSVGSDRFRREREAIGKAIDAHGYDHDRGSFVGAFGERWLDATALLLPRTGFVDPCDPRMVSTWECVNRELGRGCLIHRYSAEADTLEGRESAFVICSFWAVEYLARAGRLAEARERMDALLAYANDVGLYSEEIDADSGAMLGNFPQAFSHSGLINAALAIREAETGQEPP